MDTETDRDGPKRTETDRNGPERTETDFRGYQNGPSGYRNGLSGNRNGPERTETDFCEYRNGLCGYRIVICVVKIDRNTKKLIQSSVPGSADRICYNYNYNILLFHLNTYMRH